MSESGSGRIDQLKDRLREAVGNSDGEVSLDSVAARMRETVGKAGSDMDVDALMARAKYAVGAVEGKVNAEKIRQWIDEVDRDTIQGWLGEAKTATGTAASFLEAQGERLADRAPGAFDKLVGTAKEALGDLLGNEELAREGELQHLKGGIESRFAEAGETAASEAADAVKPKADKATDKD